MFTCGGETSNHAAEAERYRRMMDEVLFQGLPGTRFTFGARTSCRTGVEEDAISLPISAPRVLPVHLHESSEILFSLLLASGINTAAVVGIVLCEMDKNSLVSAIEKARCGTLATMRPKSSENRCA